MKLHSFLILISLFISCNVKKNNQLQQEIIKEAFEENLWLKYTPKSTQFKLWSPSSEEVKLNLYKAGNDCPSYQSHPLNKNNNGIWEVKVNGDLKGTYYTFQIKHKGNWLAETPGIYAKAVGVNGQRAKVLDMKTTNPKNWKKDKGPELNYPNEAIIYELHIRDMSIHPESGSSSPGKYLGLVEKGTKGPGGVSTGLDHLIEMGITHVHLLPTFDHYSIDESRLEDPQFNWGYDPQNYNVPEGSFSGNPYDAEARIREFKTMVKTFHDHDIGVILDVVYNHTGRTENSNFNLEAPGYYYRKWEDGKYSNASGCGNETASEKAMMRKFMIESVKHWIKEYHIDGFRFDLMGIHDIKTMNELSKAVKEIAPDCFIYGEGWTAGDSPLAAELRSNKHKAKELPGISAFSDDLRDGLKGSVFDDVSTGFVSGAEGLEASIQMGVVGSIYHPQIDYKAVNYSDEPWANEPWQAISYVSCHDNHTLYDKLKISRKDASELEIIQMHKFANAIVLTTQGTAVLHAGGEMLRTKNGEHNSYNLNDEINQIDWNRKARYADVLTYYQNLIKLRKEHPAFRMHNAADVRKNLRFLRVENGFLSYQLENNANGDPWRNILVIYNAKDQVVDYKLNLEWKLAVRQDEYYRRNNPVLKDSVIVPERSMLIAFQE